MSESAARLGVFLNRIPAGTLERLPNERFLFRRDGNLPVEMPVTLNWRNENRIESDQLHPVFQQSLPEGVLRQSLLADISTTVRGATDELTLARIVGRSLIGRVRLADSAEELNVEREGFDYRSEVLASRRNRRDLIQDLIGRFRANAGVAGVHPKIQIDDSEKYTFAGPTHILKTFDPERFPGLAANEFLCMEIARYAGLPTPKVEISKDGMWLAVERFDRLEDGSYRGFEDFCSLANIATGWKYFGDYENLAATVRKFADDPGVEAKALFELV